MWSGSVAFGLVNVPVKLYSAISEQDIHFHLLNSDGSCRLREKLYCPETGKEYDFKDTAKGFELAPDQYIILNKDEQEQLKPEAGDVLEITDFVDLKEIDPIYLNRTYYLGPDRGGAKPYRLLFEAMEKTNKAAIGTFVMRGHQYLAAIRVGRGLLCLETMYFAEDIRDTEEVEGIERGKVDKRELALASQLIDNWTTQFKPEKYHNTYRDKVKAALEKKSKGKRLETAPKKKKAGTVVDLMSALKASMSKKGKAEKPVARAGGSKKRKKAG